MCYSLVNCTFLQQNTCLNVYKKELIYEQFFLCFLQSVYNTSHIQLDTILNQNMIIENQLHGLSHQHKELKAIITQKFMAILKLKEEVNSAKQQIEMQLLKLDHKLELLNRRR